VSYRSSRASLPLYCLPYAGASASVYVRWKRRLPAFIEVVPVELPGRGRRMNEPLEVSLPALVDRIATDVRPEPGKPFAVFGHSLGGILAFELAWRLTARGAAPAVVFVSGTRSPGHRDTERFAALETDDELRAELERLDGTPPEVLADSELMELALRVLRADFQVAGSYAGSERRRIHSPLVVLGGASDEGTRDNLVTWRDHTTSEFSLHVLPGGHFFIHQQEAELLAIIEERLRLVGLAAGSGPARATALDESASAR
jgi:surfactin synthase thioesterase subunit